MTSPQEPTTTAEGADLGAGSPPTFVVLGAAGDLTARLLLPGLAGLVNRRKVSVSLIGSDRVDWDDDRWRDRVQHAFASQVEAPEVAEVVRTTRYVRAEVTDPKDLDRLLRACSSGPVILYFALPPRLPRMHAAP